MTNIVALQKGAIDPILLSRKDAAKAVGISIRSLASLIAKGDIETRKIGGRTLIPVVELRRFCSRDYLGTMAA